MLTSKQRSKLKSLAANISPVGQVGKEGIGANMLKSFSDCLEARELIKITVMEYAPLTAKEAMSRLVELLGCEPVQVIGRRLVVYRESRDKKRIEL